jgi:tetratricopeptide (TPR) repeat protein
MVTYLPNMTVRRLSGLGFLSNNWYNICDGGDGHGTPPAGSVVGGFHGIRPVEPNTLLWARLLASRAIACAHHGFYDDAIAAANTFLKAAGNFPETEAWVSHVHHALGLAYDRLGQHDKAVPHHRLAAEAYITDPPGRAIAMADLAYSLALSGRPDEADQVLSMTVAVEDQRVRFVLAGTTAIVRYCQGRHAEAMASATQAEALADGHEEAWAVPLAEVWYWAARAARALGNGHTAALLALRAAVVADQRWHLKLSEDATQLLEVLVGKGGVKHA